MHQLTVARRLLADAHTADEGAKLAAVQQELVGSKAATAAARREVLLFKSRLAAADNQLKFMERQLQVAVNSPLAAAVAAAAAGSTGGGATGPLPSAVAEQLRRLLETKEERIR